MSVDEDEGFVWREKQTLERIKIPMGYEKCPMCNGYGKIRIKYSGPSSKSDYATCLGCQGKGFVEKGKVDEK